MPARQKVSHQDWEVTARPGWWLRRWSRFPLFFQATHPSFDILIKKVTAPQPESTNQPEPKLNFYIEFSDQTTINFLVDVSGLRPGGTLKYRTQKILLAPTGDARVCLDAGPHLLKGHQFQTLYAFVVSSEATLVFLLLNVLLGALLALLLKL
ncbi:MAG: hypothetical protein HY680_04540 [Chloroflexi bacterium]|nr:hypothetical protein [Chloroflexota bacterium]